MAALCLLLAALAVIFHIASGSARSELGSHPDEAAHYITGLMVHDYLASGFHESPLHYADEYYRHYPKIGLGVWPPLFYVLQAIWTLLLPGGPPTVLHLIAVLGFALAAVTGWWLWREYGAIEAVTGAVLLMALPLVQQYSNMIMAEMLSALLMFGAAGFFACYLEGAEWRGAIGFGVCAAMAILTKGTGLALVFVPAGAILLLRRFDLLGRLSLWVSALLVAALAGPWTWHFRNEGRGGWEEPSPSLHFTQKAIFFYGQEMCVALGSLLVLLALGGIAFLFLPRRQKPAIAVCSLSLVMGVWIFQCMAPVGLEARHLTPAMPALLVLAMAGMHAATGRDLRVRLAAAAGVLALFFGWPAVFPPAAPAPGYGSLGNHVALSPYRVPKKMWGGFEPLAEQAMAAGPGARVLVASDSRGEGMFIADIAARDSHRPSYTVERASKILAVSTWSGSGYESLYQTADEVRHALAQAGITEVVTDRSLPAPPAHEQLLIQALGGGLPASSSTAVRDGRKTGMIVLNLLSSGAK